ncbi:MFS transporter [Nocardia sp. CA-136227]|uniref:MFS transporter n=1 Tax=Nocardia sp. CA-136227 TaxID=3239979 RepID=UPI003D968DED
MRRNAAIEMMLIGVHKSWRGRMADGVGVKSGSAELELESTSWRAWVAVWAVGFSVFVVTTTEMAPVGLLPEIARDLDVSSGTAGIAVTAFGLIAGLLAPVSTVVSGRFDRRALLIAILAVFTAGNLLSAMSSNYGLFIFSRLATGVIHGLMWSIVAAIAIRLVRPRDGVRATAIAFSGISVALVLGVPLGSLIGSYSGWRAAFGALAILSLLCSLVVFAFVPRLPMVEAVAWSDFRRLVRARPLLAALIVTCVVVVGNYAAYTYVAPFMLDERHILPSMVGPYLLAYGIAGVAGNFMSGFALDRLGSPAKVLGVFGFVVVCALVLLPLLDSRNAVIVLLMVWGETYSGLPVALQTLVLRSGGDSGQAATSAYVLVFNCSIALGALLGGFAIDTSGATAPIWVGAMFCLLGVLVSLVITRVSPVGDTQNS